MARRTPMMQRGAAVLGLLVALLAGAGTGAQERDSRVYELRIYYAPPGKLPALEARFRDHTTKLFEKHGMTNVGYWTPIDNPNNELTYILAYPSREAREKSWKEFLADPAWKKVRAESEAQGKIVERVESRFLSATDYSPPIKPANV